MARNILEDVLQVSRKKRMKTMSLSHFTESNLVKPWQERAARLATANICLTDIEEQDTIQDLIIEEKESFAGLMDLVGNDEDVGMSSSPANVIDIFNEAMETGDEEARSNLSSYGIELSELLEVGDRSLRGKSSQSPGKIDFKGKGKVEKLYDAGNSQSATSSPGFSHISIRFSRNQNIMKETIQYELQNV